MHILLLAAISAGAAAPEPIGVITVMGDGVARACYEAAAGARGTSDDNLRNCDRALASPELTRHDLVASRVNRGIVRMRRGDERGGLEDFEAAVALDPAQPEALLNTAIALLRRGSSSEAVPLFSRALELRTARPELAHFGRAIAHEQAGRITDAYHDYRQAAALKPDWIDPREELRRFRVQPRNPSRS